MIFIVIDDEINLILKITKFIFKEIFLIEKEISPGYFFIQTKKKTKKINFKIKMRLEIKLPMNHFNYLNISIRIVLVMMLLLLLDKKSE